MVIGEYEKMPSAFIQPDFEHMINWAKRKKIDIGASPEEIVNHPKVRARIKKEISNCNKNFGDWQRVKRIELTPDVWTIEGGHLTPTLKLKRHAIKEKYQELYKRIYGHYPLKKENRVHQVVF